MEFHTGNNGIMLKHKNAIGVMEFHIGNNTIFLQKNLMAKRIS